MSEFDPTQPAVLHDKISGKMIPWSGEEAARFLSARPAEGIKLGQFLFDGWGNPLGG